MSLSLGSSIAWWKREVLGAPALQPRPAQGARALPERTAPTVPSPQGGSQPGPAVSEPQNSRPLSAAGSLRGWSGGRLQTPPTPIRSMAGHPPVPGGSQATCPGGSSAPLIGLPAGTLHTHPPGCTRTHTTQIHTTHITHTPHTYTHHTSHTKDHTHTHHTDTHTTQIYTTHTTHIHTIHYTHYTRTTHAPHTH